MCPVLLISITNISQFVKPYLATSYIYLALPHWSSRLDFTPTPPAASKSPRLNLACYTHRAIRSFSDWSDAVDSRASLLQNIMSNSMRANKNMLHTGNQEWRHETCMRLVSLPIVNLILSNTLCNAET